MLRDTTGTGLCFQAPAGGCLCSRIGAPFSSQKEIYPARISRWSAAAMERPPRSSVNGREDDCPSSDLHRNSALNAAAVFVQSTLRTLQTDKTRPTLRCTNLSPSSQCTDFSDLQIGRETDERAEKPPETAVGGSSGSQIPPAGIRKRSVESSNRSGGLSVAGIDGKVSEKARQIGGNEIQAAVPRRSRLLAMQTPTSVLPSNSSGEGPFQTIGNTAVVASPSSYVLGADKMRSASVDVKFSGKRDDNLGTRIQLRSTAILKFLVDESYASEKRIRQTFGNNPDISKTLRMLVKQHRVRRFGVGGRRSPFVYMAITSPGLSELEKLNEANANGIM